ncbi:hypothetical protein J3458_009355 [Metarhizium acridum]|uniref:uncharacterized protein n=1 Tax=Metarhizium acridum TaxID=92637 RepID=UPI001C6BF88B|nr:hypothetical protein J3458_009355 [Metarhizium acridum]
MSDNPLYEAALNDWHDKWNYSEYVMKHIDDGILALQNQLVTPQALNEIRRRQAEPWLLNVGYLDYVTDDRCDNYIRLYNMLASPSSHQGEFWLTIVSQF